jgi:hypothetical protein
MSDDPTLSRRAVLKLAVAASISVLIRSQLPGAVALQHAHQALLPKRLAALLAHPESAKVIGGEYLRKYPQEAHADILLDQIASRLAASDAGLFGSTDHQLRERLDGMIRADFAVDRVVKLRGWILSATEARLCALAVLL